MSSTIAGLRSLFQGRDPKQPEDLSPDFKVDLPEIDEGEDVDRSSSYVNVDRAGEVFGIEYTNTQGSLSRRWVTVEGFKKSNEGNWSLCGYCFVRKRIRSFPVVQIKALFDAQGEPITLSEIFPSESGVGPTSTVLSDTSGRATIATCRDGLRALTALAKIDGHLHEKEVETILSYAEAQSKSAGIDVSRDDKKAIQRYIRNLQPTGDVVTDCLDRIGEMDGAIQKDFFWHAHRVMDADGLQDEAEIKMFLEISEALSHEL
jgi:hypothetical protein